VRGSIAYVSQTAWIQNASIKDNILFGRLYEQEKYEFAVRVSALKKDLALMSHGEKRPTCRICVSCMVGLRVALPNESRLSKIV
jgi:hypothetical protein